MDTDNKRFKYYGVTTGDAEELDIPALKKYVEERTKTMCVARGCDGCTVCKEAICNKNS